MASLGWNTGPQQIQMSKEHSSLANKEAEPTPGTIEYIVDDMGRQEDGEMKAKLRSAKSRNIKLGQKEKRRVHNEMKAKLPSQRRHAKANKEAEPTPGTIEYIVEDMGRQEDGEMKAKLQSVKSRNIKLGQKEKRRVHIEMKAKLPLQRRHAKANKEAESTPGTIEYIVEEMRRREDGEMKAKLRSAKSRNIKLEQKEKRRVHEMKAKLPSQRRHAKANKEAEPTPGTIEYIVEEMRRREDGEMKAKLRSAKSRNIKLGQKEKRRVHNEMKAKLPSQRRHAKANKEAEPTPGTIEYIVEEMGRREDDEMKAKLQSAKSRNIKLGQKEKRRVHNEMKAKLPSPRRHAKANNEAGHSKGKNKYVVEPVGRINLEQEEKRWLNDGMTSKLPSSIKRCINLEQEEKRWLDDEMTFKLPSSRKMSINLEQEQKHRFDNEMTSKLPSSRKRNMNLEQDVKHRIAYELKAKLPSSKRRRINLEDISQRVCEDLNGPTYQSVAKPKEDVRLGTEQLPAAVPEGDIRPDTEKLPPAVPKVTLPPGIEKLLAAVPRGDVRPGTEELPAAVPKGDVRPGTEKYPAAVPKGDVRPGTEKYPAAVPKGDVTPCTEKYPAAVPKGDVTPGTENFPATVPKCDVRPGTEKYPAAVPKGDVRPGTEKYPAAVPKGDVRPGTENFPATVPKGDVRPGTENLPAAVPKGDVRPGTENLPAAVPKGDVRPGTENLPAAVPKGDVRPGTEELPAAVPKGDVRPGTEKYPAAVPKGDVRPGTEKYPAAVPKGDVRPGTEKYPAAVPKGDVRPGTENLPAAVPKGDVRPGTEKYPAAVPKGDVRPGAEKYPVAVPKGDVRPGTEKHPAAVPKGDVRPGTEKLSNAISKGDVRPGTEKVPAAVSKMTLPLGIEELPVAVPKGDFRPLKLPQGKEPALIMFDLETTDLIRGPRMPHITQISAVEPTSGSVFNSYVTPKVPVSVSAQQITGIVMSSRGMSVNGQPVCSESVRVALNRFIEWLESYANVMLVAHNGRRFDYPILMSTLMSVGLVDRIFLTVFAFVDSLPVFRKKYPNLSSYKQNDLVSNLLNKTYAAHNAVEDVKYLGQLVLHKPLSVNELLPFTFSPVAVYHQRFFSIKKSKNLGSLRPLIYGKVLTKNTAENIAGSGLSLRQLKKIFDRDGENGLINTFTCQNEAGQPRVTIAKRTLKDVIPKLGDFFRRKIKK